MSWTRAEFLQRGASAALVVGAGGLAGWRLLDRASGSPAPPVQHFVSRPDLQPPAITVHRRAGSTAPGHLFLAPSSGPGARGVLILDDAGEVVWFRPTTLPAMNFRAALFRGAPVLTWWQALPGGGLGNGEHVIVDSSYREVARFPAANGRPSDLHEFLLTPEGTALVASYEIRDADLSRFGGRKQGRVMGGVAQEIEVPSARLVHEWRSLDYIALEEAYSRVGNAWDYFHINSIAIDADGHLLVSARNTWAVYKVHRQTGRVLWRLGGKRSDFTLGPGVRFAWQHDARSHDNGRLLTLFDNGSSPLVEPQSRGLLLSVDTERMHVSLARAITHRPAVSSRALGSVQLLENGNVLVGWGVKSYFTEYGPDGSVRFDASLPHGGENYRALRFVWSGRPVERPAARLAADGRTLVASWNGSTELAGWRVEAGRALTSMADGATVPKRGFETPLPLPEGTRYAVAVALDAVGAPLARSTTVRVG
jgi:hypothetical protein